MFLTSTQREARSDEELFLALRSRDPRALTSLWDRYAHLLFGVAVKYLRDRERSKDMVLALFADLPTLAVRHDVRAFRPWVHQVMRNRCMMALRGVQKEFSVVDDLEQNGGSEDDQVLHEATLQRMEEALERIDQAQCACIRAFYFERLSYQRIAAVHRLSVDQVRSHLQNGRRMLRKLLSGTRNPEDHGN